MEIISHRGYWKKNDEKNQLISFERSFAYGFGTETDIRDCNGELVISHDLPLIENNNISLDQFFSLYNNYKLESVLALNIKSDGLQEQLKEKLVHYDIKNYFVFDMSIPDTRGYIRNDLNIYTRLSEIETTLIYGEIVKGVWLDAFEGLWYNQDFILNILSKNIKIAMVSFELHRRNHLDHWKWIKENEIHLQENIILCTDIPEDAKAFFYL